MSYPKDKGEAQDILNAVRAGCGQRVPGWLIDYCLWLTGDLT